MKIAYNPTTAAALTAAPSNNDITFDLKGVAIYAKGVKFKGTDTTYSVFKKHTASGNTGGYNGLVPVPSYTTTAVRFLREDGTWVTPTNTTYSVVSSTANGLAPAIGTTCSTTIATQADEWVLTSTKGGTPTWRKLPANAFKNDNTNTTYTLSGGLSGNNYTVTLTPSSGSATTATIPAMTGATSSVAGKAGLVPAPGTANTGQFLKGDGTWATPSDTHWTTHLYIGAKDAASNAETTNGNTYIKVTDNSTIRNQYIIKGAGRATVASDASGNITITSPIVTWSEISGKPSSFAPSSHTHSQLQGWADTRSAANVPNDYNGIFRVQGIKTAGTTLGLTSTQAGTYATIIGWRGWSDSSGGYAWEIASTDKNRLYVRSGSTTSWNNSWTAIAYTTDLTWSNISGKPSTFAPSAHNHPTSQINALTSYTKATAAAALATTDSLNAALGKLEYKLDVAYDLVTKANDSDGTIENLKEILDVLAGIKDTETIKAIVGKYLPLAGGTLIGNLWFGAGNTDKYITFTSATTGTDASNSWRIGYIGSGSGDGNHFVLQSTKATTNTWTNALSITNEGLIATFASTVIAPTFLGRLAYTYLTGSGTTANQAIVSTGTANGWTLKTLGSRAFDSTAYLPLAGGTMTLGEGLKFHADENYFGTNLDARIISLLDGNGTTCDGGLIIDERCTSNGTTTITELLRIRDAEFKWKGLNILHSGNSSVTKSGQTLTVTINGTSQSLTNSTYNFSGASFTSGNQNTAEHDADKITSNGVWYYTANGPATSLGASTNDGALYSQAYSTSWVGQIALDYRDGDLFTRGRNNGTWTAWKRVAYANDIPTVTNYYWANVQVSSSSSTTTTPTFAKATATTSVTTPLVTSSSVLTLNGVSGVYLKYNNTDGASIVLSSTYFKPFDAANNKLSLGTSSARWSNVYSVLGNFSGLITATSGVLIGGTADIGWYLYDNRICAGTSAARNVNVGSLLVSNAWADSSKVPTNGIYSKGNVSAAGFVKASSSDSYVLLGGGGHKALSDFMLKSEELTTNLTTISKSLTVTQAWMDTGIKYTDLPATGTYIVQVAVYASNDGIWDGYWSGVMTWYRSGTNATDANEILLHLASHALGSNNIYLRTLNTANSDGRHLRLLISASKNLSAAYTFTFKFKRII